MPAIFVNRFAGERPKIDPRHLPNEAAQIAQGCHFNHGNLSPLKQPSVQSDTVSVNTRTLYRYINTHWFTWDTDVDVVNSPIANDPWERVYFTGDGYPKVTNNMIYAGSNMPAMAYQLGVPAPQVPIIAVVSEAGEAEEAVDPNDDETRYYTYTYVTEQGEEGAPCEASQRIDILTPDDPETFVTLSLSPPDVNLSNITHCRIYRTVTGGGIADYLMVAEVPIATVNFIDQLNSDELGVALETYDYEMPDPNMSGLTSMANGILAGFMGNTVCFSEAYLPYAWPNGYQHTTEHNIVAMVPMGSSLAVLTEGYPWLFSGVSPDGISGRNLEFNQACMSKRSAVLVNGNLIYASPDGLVALSTNGLQLLTSQIVTKEQWQEYEPATINAYCQEGRYLAFYGESLNKCFMLDPNTGDFRHFDVAAMAGFNSVIDDDLYLCNNGVISQWEGSQAPMDYLWRSKEFHFSDISFAAAMVKGDVVNAGMRLFVDGQIVIDLDIGNIPTQAFRLPPDRGRVWEFELYGTGEIESVSIATSMNEIGELMNGA